MGSTRSLSTLGVIGFLIWYLLFSVGTDRFTAAFGTTIIVLIGLALRAIWKRTFGHRMERRRHFKQREEIMDQLAAAKYDMEREKEAERRTSVDE